MEQTRTSFVCCNLHTSALQHRVTQKKINMRVLFKKLSQLINKIHITIYAHNCKTSLNWPCPVSNEILSCFSEADHAVEQ